MQSRRYLWLWLIPLLLLVMWLGARSLNADLIFVDEYWSIRNSGGAFYGPLSPAGIWNRVIELDPGGVGVLYYVLLSAWGSLAGWTPFAARAFSLILGLLAVAGTYRLGRDLFSARVGLYAAAALGLSAFYIDYLHEMRSYTLYALFTILTVWTYWKLVTAKKEPSFVLYGVLGIGFVGLAYTHYVALAIPAAIGLYHLLFVRKNRRWWLIVLVMIVSALLFVPWLNVTLDVIQRGVDDTNRQSTSMGAGQTVETLLYAFSSGSIALLVLVAGYTLPDRRRETRFVWLMALVALVAALIVNALVPFMVHIRYLIMLWPLLALIVGLGIVRLGQIGVNPIFVLVIWLGFGLWQTSNPSFIGDLFGSVYRAPQAGVYAALDVLKERAMSDDLVIFHIAEPGYEPFQYFVLDYLMHDIPGRYDQFERMNNSFAHDDANYLIDVKAAINDVPYIWTLTVPDLPFTQHTLVVNSVLESDYARCETILDRPDIQMKLYAHRLYDMNEQVSFSTATAGGKEIRLLPLILQPDRTGNTLDAVLGWLVDGTVPANTYSVALHLENADGQIVAQGDHPLPIGGFGCSAGHIALDDLAPGEYTLRAGVYTFANNQRLTGTVSTTGEQGQRLVLSTITIDE